MDKELKNKLDNKANEKWVGVRPPAKLCKTCAFAFKDTEYTVGAEKANCEMYFDEDKPTWVLWGNEDCPYYKKEEA